MIVVFRVNNENVVKKNDLLNREVVKVRSFLPFKMVAFNRGVESVFIISLF